MLNETAVIAQNGTMSAAVETREYSVIGILIPALDSCTVFINGSNDNVTYTRVQKEDWSADLTTGTITTTGKAIILGSLFPFRYLKVETSNAQTSAARTFYVSGKKI